MYNFFTINSIPQFKQISLHDHETTMGPVQLNIPSHDKTKYQPQPHWIGLNKSKHELHVCCLTVNCKCNSSTTQYDISLKNYDMAIGNHPSQIKLTTEINPETIIIECPMNWDGVSRSLNGNPTGTQRL